MKILYAARMGRFDLLRTVNALGSRIASWTKLCDAKLHRLVCYIKSALNLKMHAWVTLKKILKLCFTAMQILQVIGLMLRALVVCSCAL